VLSSGGRLGHYEVLSFLGAGGLGQGLPRSGTPSSLAKWRSKFFPETSRRARHRLARFEREGRLLASLNHPNIATLFGLEQSGELHFLVMELVLGETLSERLARGALPVGEALLYFRQIRSQQQRPGLDAGREKAHVMGPRANYDVTPYGQRFVMVQASAPESRPNQIHIVFNWFQDLKRRSPRARGN
jgi:hypothetical protein